MSRFFNVSVEKSFEDSFDKVTLDKHRDTEWTTISMSTTSGVDMGTLTLRSEEAVRDLHYALGRLLSKADHP